MDLKAKDCSLWGKIIGGAVILICSVLKWVNVLSCATIQEICLVGGCIMGLFSTVDINILVDKLVGLKSKKVCE